MSATRGTYLLIAGCMAVAFSNLERIGLTLTPQQADVILDSFCDVLKEDRKEFSKDLFIDSLFTAADQIQRVS